MLLIPKNNRDLVGVSFLPVAVLYYAVVYGCVKLAEKSGTQCSSKISHTPTIVAATAGRRIGTAGRSLRRLWRGRGGRRTRRSCRRGGRRGGSFFRAWLRKQAWIPLNQEIAVKTGLIRFIDGHENDPPKRVIGLALASILFHTIFPGLSSSNS
jgi:hypothetical protein